MSSRKDALLVLRNVSAGYPGADDVIHSIDFELQRGEVAGVVSLDMSGGKSTLVKVAGGLLEPRTGAAYFAGDDIYSMSYSADQRFRERCSLVLEGDALLVNRSIWDNVALPLRYHAHLSRRELKISVERLLSRCGYNEDPHALPWQVSARGRRLAAFARALARDPELVIVDRFFEGLEMPDWRRLFELVMELNQHERVSWLLISELDTAIFQVAERIAVLSGGRLIAHGFRKELFEDKRIRDAFDLSERSPTGRRRKDSERIIVVDSSEERIALSDSAPADDWGETINIDGMVKKQPLSGTLLSGDTFNPPTELADSNEEDWGATINMDELTSSEPTSESEEES